jgi:hypothetical protein
MSASFQNSALPNTLDLSAQNGQLSIDLNQTIRGVYLAGTNPLLLRRFIAEAIGLAVPASGDLVSVPRVRGCSFVTI